MSDVATEVTPAATPAPTIAPVSPEGAHLPLAGVPPDFAGLGIVAHRLPDQDCWSFGVNLGGVYVELQRRKLGGIDDDLQEAATPGFKAKRWDLAVSSGLVRP